MSHDHSDEHTEPPPDVELRVKALETLLVEKGLVDLAAPDVLIDTYENQVRSEERRVGKEGRSRGSPYH